MEPMTKSSGSLLAAAAMSSFSRCVHRFQAAADLQPAGIKVCASHQIGLVSRRIQKPVAGIVVQNRKMFGKADSVDFLFQGGFTSPAECSFFHQRNETYADDYPGAKASPLSTVSILYPVYQHPVLRSTKGWKLPNKWPLYTRREGRKQHEHQSIRIRQIGGRQADRTL